MTHSGYIEIFRHIAQSNPDLEHSETHPTFVRIIKSVSEPFEDKLYLEEFINKNHSKLNYPCICVFSYSHGYTGEDDSPLHKRFDGLYAILDKAKPTRSTSQTQFDHLEDCLDNAERISEEILISLSEALREIGCEFVNLDSLYGEKSGPDINNVVAQSIYFSFTKRTAITL